MQRIEKDAFFCLYPKRHKDLYKTMHSQLTVSLIIIFRRLVIAGEAKIRPHEILDPKICQKLLGLDANSLYLHAIVQNNPTGYFCLIRKRSITDLIPAESFVFKPTNG